MNFFIELSNALRARIIVRRDTEDRLLTTCFRGRHRRLAGNFRLFRNAHDVFDNVLIRRAFEKQIRDEINGLHRKRGSSANVSFTVHGPPQLGWESTDRRDRYAEEALESFQPNRVSTALRVKTARTDLQVPFTDLVTFVCEVKRERHEWTVIVQSMYPGVDIGELRGDVTKREKRVFFDWDHPGA